MRWALFLSALLATSGSMQAWQLSNSAPLSATVVLGQPDFTSPICDNPVLSPEQQLCHPVGVAVDNRSGLLFVADGDNNRVLIWPSAAEFTDGQPAAVVLGQPDFIIGRKCTGPTTARTICDPNGLAVDISAAFMVLAGIPATISWKTLVGRWTATISTSTCPARQKQKSSVVSG